MIRADCDAIRDHLDAFADGELRGDELRHVAAHVESCRRCAEEVDVRRSLGGLIRDAAALSYNEPIPAGLAAGVVARARAESYFSLRAAAGRAVDDWHWLIVGGGSVAATLVSMLICSAVLIGAATTRNADSLSALGQSLRGPSGAFYAEVSSSDRPHEIMIVQVDNNSAAAPAPPAYLVGEDREFVEALQAKLAGQGSERLGSISGADRRDVELLLKNLASVYRQATTVRPLGTLTVRRLYLVTTTEVTAKGLE
jgi:hypothetical protein